MTMRINNHLSSVLIVLRCMKSMLRNSSLTRQTLAEYKVVPANLDSQLKCGAEIVPAEDACGKIVSHLGDMGTWLAVTADR